jgi:hypothetical protein
MGMSLKCRELERQEPCTVEESLAKAEITSGICGFTATVDTRMDGSKCVVSIESDCDAIQRLGQELTEVEPFKEITFRGEGPRTLRLGAKHCYHPACPVPVGIIKAIEVEAGLALPAEATIKLSKSD